MAQRRIYEFYAPPSKGLKAAYKPLADSLGKSLTPPEALKELPPSYFVSATYDGKKGVACIKLYEPKSQRIYLWYDNTGHRSYCLTNLSPIELEKIDRLMAHPGLERFEVVEKHDPLRDSRTIVTKVIAKDPLSIGGRPKGCIRDIIPEEYAKVSGPFKAPEVKIWEAAIKYYECYIYDNDLFPGMLYAVKDGDLILTRHKEAEASVERILSSFKGITLEEREHLERWARLLEYPAPKFKRIALDIEVLSPIPTRVPDPREAAYSIACISLFGSDGRKRVLLLKREGVSEGEAFPPGVSIEYFESEEAMIKASLNALREYPFVITFNGDEFDLRYLAHRAERLGIERAEIPIELSHHACSLTHGVHIDLYKFFLNKSIQVYAFSNKYRDVSLGEIGKALVGKAKVELKKPISELAYAELATYCARDAEITLDLTSFNDDLVMRLILVLSRISRMPMDDVSRQGVSSWIRSFLYHEHRRMSALIPNADDILALKGKAVTRAVIKGKKYRGAVVVEPSAGVHFNVAVLDFLSLYPSIIKTWNLGYQSILCPHEECKVNKVPGTPHWVCTKKRALESLLIGTLRDLRVEWYKPKSKDPSLSAEVRSWYDVIQNALKVILNASIPYDELVVLQDPEGEVKLMKIGEFVEASIIENGSYFDGINVISKPLKGWKALTYYHRTGQVDFAEIRAVIKHRNYDERLVEVTLASGRKVKVTQSHSLLTLDHKTAMVVSIDVEDLNVGDFVCIPIRMVKIKQQDCEVDLIEELIKLTSPDIAVLNLSKENAIKFVNAYVEAFGEHPLSRDIQVFLNGDLTLDEVKEIKEVSCDDQYVYDLSIEGSENFIGGHGLICLHNSYGAFGAESYDLYCPPVAEATAAIGRHAIVEIVEKAKDLGMEVVYGDTDSVFLRDPTEEQIEELINWSEKKLKMSLDVDRVYRYSVFSSRKKNYLGVLSDGNVDVKGLTGKKRHVPVFIKRAFDSVKEVLSKVKSKDDFEGAKKEIERIIREYYFKLKQRKWERLEDLAFHIALGEMPEKYIKTTPQHVKAALLMKEKGRELRAGDIVSFVKVLKEPYVKPVEIATDGEIDVDKYIAYLRSTLEQVLDALGLDFDEIVGLTKLERFM